MTERKVNFDFFETIKDSSVFGVYVYSENGNLVFANKAFCKMIGYSPEEITKIKLLDIIDSSQRSEVSKNIERRLNGEIFSCEYKEIYYKTKEGYLKPSINFAYTISFNNKPAGLVMIYDVTKSKIFEECYKVLSEINQLIIRSQNEEDLLKKACNILFNQEEFHIVVLGTIDRNTKLFKPKIVLGGKKIQQLFSKIRISVDETEPEGRGTVGKAFRTGQIAVSQNVLEDNGMAAWREAQKIFGVHSACSIPLFKNKQITYIMILYSNIAGIFSDEYLSLIKEMQIDISYGLDKIEKDKELKMFNEAISASMNWVVVTDKDFRIVKANKAVESISGYTLKEIIGNNPRIFKSGYHTEEFYKNLYKKITSGKQCRCTFVNRKKDGPLFYIESAIVPVVIDGKIERYVSIGRDVTKEVQLKQNIEKFSKLYKTLYNINQLLLKSTKESEILKELPKFFVDILGFKVAFIASLEDHGTLRITASYAKEDKHKYYNEFLNKEVLSDLDNKSLPFLKSLRNKRIYLENNILLNEKLKPFHKRAKIYNFHSCFSLPIIKNNEAIAVLVGISDQTDFFDRNIYKLLEQVKSDISSFLAKLEAEKWHDIFTNAMNTGFSSVVVTDENFNIVYVNDNMVKFSGYSKEELIGKHHSIFSSKTHSKEFSKRFYNTLLSHKTFTGVITYKTKNSKFVKVLMNITPYKSKDGKTYYIAIGRDITESVELQKTLEESLNKDALTGLITRPVFIRSTENFIKRAEHEKLLGAVVVINPVQFSAINHAYSFETGNKVLAKIADRLKAYFRKYDTIAKLESDKFGVLIKDIRKEEDIFIILTRLMKLLSKPYNIDGKTISIKFNTGVSLFPKDAKSAEELIEKAGVALLDVKNEANSFGFYKEDLKRKAQRIIEIKNDAMKALANKEFILYYQPYFDTKNMEIKGAEALIRWRKNDKIIPPMEFIPYLEESGTMTEVENWIIQEIAEKQKSWEKENLKPIPISINISPTSFEKKNFVANFISNIKAFDIEPTLIKIEIIERLFIENLNRSRQILNTLKQYGIKIAIDDFGTGYSSLSYISSLPIDFIKIDISFIRKMMTDTKTRSIVKAIILISKELSMKTIAEGVEASEQLDLLKEFGCDYAQGYLLSKPLPETEFKKILKHSDLSQ